MKKNITDHVSAFIWDGYNDPQKVEKAFSDAERIQKEIRNMESALEKLALKINRDSEKKERYQAEIEDINKKLTINKTKRNTGFGI